MRINTARGGRKGVANGGTILRRRDKNAFLRLTYQGLSRVFGGVFTAVVGLPTLLLSRCFGDKPDS